MRVRTLAVSTRSARTQPVAPFGRIALHVEPRRAAMRVAAPPSTEKTVAAPLAFRSPKLASGRRSARGTPWSAHHDRRDGHIALADGLLRAASQCRTIVFRSPATAVRAAAAGGDQRKREREVKVL